MQRKHKALILNWLPAVLGVAVILVESTDTMSAEHTSKWLLPIWEKLFGYVNATQWAIIHHWIRKSGHFTGYGLISLGFFNGWRWSLLNKSPHRNWSDRRLIFARAAALALFSTLLLATADEWHQSFIPSRTSSPVDVGIDVSGAVVAHLLLLAVFSVTYRLRSPKMTEVKVG